MGSRSERALKCAKLCSDNNKAWQLLKIFYHGTLDELLVPYIRQAIMNNATPNAQGYISWCKSCTDPNNLYLHEQVLTYCQALFNYRHGLRKNDHRLIANGKEMFCKIFLAGPIQKYQAISVFDTCDYLLYHEEIRTLIETNNSFGLSGTDTKGEDLDFKLETINQKSKAWVSGVPKFRYMVTKFQEFWMT